MIFFTTLAAKRFPNHQVCPTCQQMRTRMFKCRYVVESLVYQIYNTVNRRERTWLHSFMTIAFQSLTFLAQTADSYGLIQLVTVRTKTKWPVYLLFHTDFVCLSFTFRFQSVTV